MKLGAGEGRAVEARAAEETVTLKAENWIGTLGRN
jgi:hypothetical protein